MLDNNWEMIDGPAAHKIEVLNYDSQVNVIESLFHFLMHHTGKDGTCSRSPSQEVLKEFHRTATLFLLRAPGNYRQEKVVVAKNDGTVIYDPPESENIQSHLDRFFKELFASWNNLSAIEIGAFCLWFINWVHPFKNGNGRSARAFSYACISLKLGFILPGTPTLIDLIMRNRKEYEAALGHADNTYGSTGTVDLSMMNSFVEKLLTEQLSNI